MKNKSEDPLNYPLAIIYQNNSQTNQLENYITY